MSQPLKEKTGITVRFIDMAVKYIPRLVLTLHPGPGNHRLCSHRGDIFMGIIFQQLVTVCESFGSTRLEYIVAWARHFWEEADDALECWDFSLCSRWR